MPEDANLRALISTRVNTVHLQTESIGHELEVFLRRYNEGHRALSELVPRESLQVRQHVTAQSKKTELAVRRHTTHEVTRSEKRVIKGIEAGITGLKTDRASRAHRERLLASLKYTGMNERRNRVSESFPSTFDWIFAADRDSDEATNTGSNENKSRPDITWPCFRDWLRSEETTYWISGEPGSGKTTLVKHILNHRLTQSYLATWRSDAVIISHFFWRPGTPMQQNIRGMLSSLVYQLLETQPKLTDAVLSNIHGALSKDADTDWSTQDLRDTLSFVMKASQRSLCIFLDGLDEMHPGDDMDDLLELMAQWKQGCNGSIKFCLASRPELRIRQRLGPYPHLCLECLVANDLKHYAESQLKPFKDDDRYKDLEDHYNSLIYSLVGKADGVFLWLCLAIKDLKRGFANGDGPKHLQRRIDRLHGDIESLYEDMWSRMNKDEDIYRETAALYLKLVITDQAMPDQSGLTVLSMLLCSSEIANEALDSSSDFRPISVDKLLADCKQTEQQIQAMCAGLIGIYEGNLEDEVNVVGWDGERLAYLSEYTSKMRYGFIHRTAFDFLLDTMSGRKILSHDKTCEMELRYRIIKADLAACQIFRMRSVYARFEPEPVSRLHCVDVQLESIEDMTSPTKMDQSSEASSEDKPLGSLCQKKLWIYCQQLHDSGKLRYPNETQTPRVFHDKNYSTLLGAAQRWSPANSYIQFAIATNEVSQQLRSQLMLHGASNIVADDWVLGLLAMGANPNMVSSFKNSLMRFYPLETPWTFLLGTHLASQGLRREAGLQHSFVRKLAAFIKHGAIPGADVYLIFRATSARLKRMLFDSFLRSLNNGGYLRQHSITTWSGIIALDALTSVEEICRVTHWDPQVNMRCIDGLVQDLRRRARGPFRSQMRVIALMEGSNIMKSQPAPFKEPSPDDSAYLMETLRTAWSIEKNDLVCKDLADRCQQVFKRTPPESGGDDVHVYLERLGCLTDKVYQGGDAVENPWKENLV
jgi:hypothetical protein